MDFVSRLKQYMDYRNVGISQFADTCMIPRPTLSQILNGRNKKISDELITKIHIAYPDIFIPWLMFGEGEMLTNGNIEISEHQKQDSQAKSDQQQAEIQQDTSSVTNFGDVEQKNPKKIAGSSTYPMGENMSHFNDVSTKESTHSETNSVFSHAQQSQFIDFTGMHSSAPPTEYVESISSQTRQDAISSTVLNTGKTDAEVKNSPQEMNSDSMSGVNNQNHIVVAPTPGKRITNIVVFYSDNSFESFSPSVVS